ncbi:MAG: hypothetical protein AB7F35_21535 [Acetobacteraceae bacterium]|uniref:hypothetical protein n=1 Tax=Bradyrhizobium sp. TaxID=376 RepID=UPI003D111EAC
MKKISLLAAVLWLALAPAVLAQGHSHGDKGPKGGAMQDVAGVHAELMVADRTLTVNIYDEDNKPVPASGFSGSALVGSGQTRQVVQLASGSDNALTGTASAAVPRGAPVTLQLKAPNGKTGQAKF